jgi:O-glycosyl hydrolase
MARRKKKRTQTFGASAAKSCAVGAANKRFMVWLAKARNGHLDREFLRVARQESRKRGANPAKSIKAVATAIKYKIGKAKVICAVPWIKKSDRLCKELSLFHSADYTQIAGCYLDSINFGFKKGRTP